MEKSTRFRSAGSRVRFPPCPSWFVFLIVKILKKPCIEFFSYFFLHFLTPLCKWLSFNSKAARFLYAVPWKNNPWKDKPWKRFTWKRFPWKDNPCTLYFLPFTIYLVHQHFVLCTPKNLYLLPRIFYRILPIPQKDYPFTRKGTTTRKRGTRLSLKRLYPYPLLEKGVQDFPKRYGKDKKTYVSLWV